MNLLFAGDTHGPLDHLQGLPADVAVVHVGDFAPLNSPLEHALPEELHDRFWFIPGNHDYDKPEYHEQVFTEYGRSRCFHLKVIQIGDLRIAGLGGIFSEKTWWPKSELTAGMTTRAVRLRETPRKERFCGGLSLKQRKYVFREDFDLLAKSPANVLVCHEAPTTHRHGFAGIDALARRLGVHTVVHGHHHVDYQHRLEGDINVIGVGLRGLTDLNGHVWKPGEHSTRRRS